MHFLLYAFRMSVFKQIVGWLFLPIKMLFELIDPVLRYLEMAVNIPLAFVLGNLVELINGIPTVWHIHIGELVLGVLAGVSFGLLNVFVFHLTLHVAWVVLICIGVAIVGYFVSYLLFKFVINFITSLVSLIFVVIRVAIYLPGSIWMMAVKTVIPIAVWMPLFFLKLDYWTSDVRYTVAIVLILVVLLLISSVIMLAIRRDVKFKDVGILGGVSLEKLSSFTHSIGLYIMTFYGVPVYIGRAIEFNNGGLRKRIRDYQRGANTHSSGTWIQEHLDELHLYVLELGHTGEDVDFVIDAEETMISSIYTKLNKVDASVSYVLNIAGYVFGAGTACVLLWVFLGFSPVAIVFMVYAVLVLAVCILLYVVENSNKW